MTSIIDLRNVLFFLSVFNQKENKTYLATTCFFFFFKSFSAYLPMGQSKTLKCCDTAFKIHNWRQWKNVPAKFIDVIVFPIVEVPRWIHSSGFFPYFVKTIFWHISKGLSDLSKINNIFKMPHRKIMVYKISSCFCIYSIKMYWVFLLY